MVSFWLLQYRSTFMRPKDQCVPSGHACVRHPAGQWPQVGAVYIRVRARIAISSSVRKKPHVRSKAISLPLTVLVLTTQASSAMPELTFVSERKPTATIVIARHPTQAAAASAVELREHLFRITGVRLAILPDTARTTGTRILVGESAATRAFGLTTGAFASQEYLIDFHKGDLALVGRDAVTSYGIQVIGSPKRVNGVFGRALSFNGQSDSISITAKTGFDDNHGTLAAWVRLVEGSKGDVLRLDGGSPWSYHVLTCRDRSLRYMTYDGKLGVPPVASAQLALGWHYVVMTWSAAQTRKELFIDGTSAGTAPYTPTHCANAHLGIGAIVEYNPSNYFKGSIDSVRLSNQAQANGRAGMRPQDQLPGTSLALDFDESAGPPHLSDVFDRLELGSAVLPNPYDEQATAYATHHFLEQFCGVRWYGPTELGLVAPQKATLTVSGASIRRRPSFRWRNIMPISTWGNLMPTVAALWDNPSKDQLRLYAFRMRNGGEHFTCTHSFYGFYDRFWQKNPKHEQVWVGQRPDWFVHDTAGQPPEMCYSNPGFIRQVVTDARDFFNGKGLKDGESAVGDFFALGPMDNDNFCPCPGCDRDLALYANNRHFANGRYSNYIFEFSNRVAHELAKTHPDKYVSVLTYASWAKHPDQVRLERNIAVQLCLGVNNYWVPATERNELAIYNEWVSKEKGRPIYLWLYPEFPEAIALLHGFTAFPGFNARGIARQMKMYYRDRIRGLFPEGITTQLNEYVYNQLAFDATQDSEHLITEFFDLYYGAAADPMRRLWMEIEGTFSNSANYPSDVQTADKDFHQTEEMAWKYLGTAERILQWGRYLETAKSLASTDAERARVALFERGQWVPILMAKRLYDNKTQYQAQVERERILPPRSYEIPALRTNANGDARSVDWTAGAVLQLDHGIQGYPTDRNVSAVIAHDQHYLYLQLQETGDTSGLARTDAIFNSDDWEIFIAPSRAKPYRQIGINAQGKLASYAYGEAAPWNPKATVISDVQSDRWRVWLCIPLVDLVPGGLASDRVFYLNVVRGSTGSRGHPALSPNFSSNFHDPSRLAAFKLL